MHFINGHLTAVFIDEDTTNRMAEGLLDCRCTSATRSGSNIETFG